MPLLAAGSDTPPAEATIGSRNVYFEGNGPGEEGTWATTPVILRDKLQAGNRIAGPAVIEEVSATTVLYPGDRAEVHPSGVLLVECQP